MSPNGKQVMVKRSGHHIQVDRPQVVTDAIREVVFKDPVFVNLEEESVETLRIFVARLKAAAQEESAKPVDEGEAPKLPGLGEDKPE